MEKDDIYYESPKIGIDDVVFFIFVAMQTGVALWLLFTT